MPKKIDPSRTTLLRRKFESDMIRRFKKISKAIKLLVVDEDVFGLKPANKAGVITNQANRAWEFQTNPQKVKSYREWLQRQIDLEILTPVSGINNKPWTAPYIESAYRKGVVRAYTQVRQKELTDDTLFTGGQDEFLRQAFSAPIPQQKIELLYERSYTDLRGVTTAMDTEMSRILADGLSKGLNPLTIARTLTDNVSKLTNVRARRIARTEIIRAHAEGQLDSYELLDVEDVGILAEWSTAGDDRVCPLCDPLDGAVLKIDEARGLLPRHPNCRCAWTPALKDRKEKGQKRGKLSAKAIDKSVLAEKPKTIPRTREEVIDRSRWLGKELI